MLNSHDMLIFHRQAYLRCVWLCRGRHFSQETRKYNILFMGRDEFSCGVFRELYAADGASPLLRNSYLDLNSY